MLRCFRLSLTLSIVAVSQLTMTVRAQPPIPAPVQPAQWMGHSLQHSYYQRPQPRAGDSTPEPSGRANFRDSNLVTIRGIEEIAGGSDVALHNPVDEPLPPLAEELRLHGGSYLYEPEGGDRRLAPSHHSEDGSHDHSQHLRLSEGYRKPRPLTAFQKFLGSDAVHPRYGMQWFGEEGFQWEPRFVGYGSYEMFAIVLEEGGRRQDGIGHQLLIDLDLQLTGTERIHMQFRPLGKKNSGGSFLRLNDPMGYNDNSTLIPDRWWAEGEFYSIFSGLFDDPFPARDYHFVAGKFPFSLHNSLLINDDITGIAINKNTILWDPLSNLNLQAFYGFDDVDAFAGVASDVAGINATADYRHVFIEATYAHLQHSRDSGRNADYVAGSVTNFFGPLSLAGRALAKFGDESGRGDGQLYVLESNYTRTFEDRFACALGLESGVFYANIFKATSGWNSISGGNFDRLRSTFAVDPLVSIARARNPDDTVGGALGMQLFRHHEDESIVPEIAYEEPNGTPVWGLGLRYLRKIGRRTYLDANGVWTRSSDRSLEREGVFLSTFIVF